MDMLVHHYNDLLDDNVTRPKHPLASLLVRVDSVLRVHAAHVDDSVKQIILQKARRWPIRVVL